MTSASSKEYRTQHHLSANADSKYRNHQFLGMSRMRLLRRGNIKFPFSGSCSQCPPWGPVAAQQESGLLENLAFSCMAYLQFFRACAGPQPWTGSHPRDFTWPAFSSGTSPKCHHEIPVGPCAIRFCFCSWSGWAKSYRGYSSRTLRGQREPGISCHGVLHQAK